LRDGGNQGCREQQGGPAAGLGLVLESYLEAGWDWGKVDGTSKRQNFILFNFY
jgi:hypothetical protein